MKILIWGMGYVGIVTAVCLTKLGHTVIGIETNIEKVVMLNNGKSPIREPQLENMLLDAVKNKKFKATQNYREFDNDFDVSFICVGTPIHNSGEMSLKHVIDVTYSIGDYIIHNPNYHLVTIRSTVPPGTSRNIIKPILQKLTHEKYGNKYGIAFNPEFLRETTAVSDFLNPQYTIIGGIDTKSSEVLSLLYEKLKGTKFVSTPEESEMLKIASNAFHALKVGFANEIGRYSEQLKIDSHKVMEIFAEDKKLNISKSYLKPGFAFGGSCLPKDLKSLTYQAKQLGVNLPILEGTLKSNDLHIEHAASKIMETQPLSVGILGLGFKPKSDDVRESPSIYLIQKLKKHGVEISVYDPDINLSTMIGSNLNYLKMQIPNIAEIICDDINQLTKRVSVIVITQDRSEFTLINSALIKEKIVIDLVKNKNWTDSATL